METNGGDILFAPFEVSKKPQSISGENMDVSKREAIAVGFDEKIMGEWDSLVDDLGVDLVSSMKENILMTEERLQNAYETVAKKLKMSTDGLKAEIQKRVEEGISTSSFFVALGTEAVEDLLLGSGRIKTRFDGQKSKANNNLAFRVAAEMRMFGFNKLEGYQPFEDRYGMKLSEEQVRELSEKNKGKRAVYGYFSDEPNGVINREGRVPPRSFMSEYGKIVVKLRRDAIERRTTCSFQDSLMSENSDVWPCSPSPATRPHYASFELRPYMDLEQLDRLKKPSVQRNPLDYTEAQFHGGVSVWDIESIHVSRNNDMTEEMIIEVKEIVRKYNADNQGKEIALVEY